MYLKYTQLPPTYQGNYHAAKISHVSVDAIFRLMQRKALWMTDDKLWPAAYLPKL